MKKIIKIIKEYFIENKAIIGGHHIQFDIGFLKKLFKEVGLNYNDYFSHRVIETSSILRFLSDVNIIPNGLESLDKAFNYFDIRLNKRHSALGDITATIELYEKLIEMISK